MQFKFLVELVSSTYSVVYQVKHIQYIYFTSFCMPLETNANDDTDDDNDDDTKNFLSMVGCIHATRQLVRFILVILILYL